MSDKGRELSNEEIADLFPEWIKLRDILPSMCGCTGRIEAYERASDDYSIVLHFDGHQEHVEFLRELLKEAFPEAEDKTDE